MQLTPKPKRKYVRHIKRREADFFTGTIGQRISKSNPGALNGFNESTVRGQAATEYGLDYKGIQVLKQREGSRIKGHEETQGYWAYSDSFLSDLVKQTYPRWETTQREKAERLLRILFLSLRLGFSAEQIAIEMRSTQAAVQRRLHRVTNEAKTMTEQEKFKQLKPTSRRLRKRVLVEAGRVIVADYDAIVSLCEHPDTKISTQAALALVEFQQTQVSLDELVAELRSLRKAAA